MMRGVLFECPACVCHALRCVALRCAALRGDEPAVERRALSPPSSWAHHYSTSKSYCDLVVEDQEGPRARGSNSPSTAAAGQQVCKT